MLVVLTARLDIRPISFDDINPFVSLLKRRFLDGSKLSNLCDFDTTKFKNCSFHFVVPWSVEYPTVILGWSIHCYNQVGGASR